MGRCSEPEGYVLRGGRAGAERLRLLNRVKWPTTEPLLRAAGLRAGISCLDVGCGGGDVTLKMAAIVGVEGNVVGVDRDEAILRLAKQEAEWRGLSVAFRRLEAEELTEQSAYDLVFARYLLSHLPRPRRAVEAMVRALRPGGRLVLEDVFFPGHVCYPANAAFARYLEIYQDVARANEGGGRGDRAASAGIGAGGRAGRCARRAGRAHLPRRRGQAGGPDYDGTHKGGGCGHRVGHRPRGGRHRRRAGQVRRRRSDADEHSAHFPGVGPQSRRVRPASGRWA